MREPLYPHILYSFPPKKHFTYFTTFHLCGLVKNLPGLGRSPEKGIGGTDKRALRVALVEFESLIWGTSSWFPLASHFDFPGSESLFGLSQDPPMVVYASLSQGGFQQRGLWVALASLLISPPRSFLVRKVSLILRMRNMKSLVFYLGRSQPPLSVVLPFHLGISVFIGREQTPSISPGSVEGHLSPASSEGRGCFSIDRKPTKARSHRALMLG